MISRSFSHYRLAEKIGSGTGVVYKAEDTELQRTVVLRFLPNELTSEQDAGTRLLREAQAAKALDHPNICGIHEIGETPGGGMFICTAYHEGETLRDRIETGPLFLQETVDIAHEIAVGLSYAHKNGIVHRDIKPANVYITRRGLVKLLDFGLAPAVAWSRAQRSGPAPATVSYLSPEQARGEAVDGRTDIWSLGVVMYEMITGRLPFQGEDDEEVIRAILNEEPAPVTKLRPDCPAHLADIVNRCLRKARENRYQSLGEFIQQLKILAVSLQPDLSMFNRPTSKTGGTGAAAVLGRVFWPAVTALSVLIVAAAILMSRFGGPGGGGRGWQTELRVAVLPLENRAGAEPGDAFVGGLSDAVATTATSLEPYHRSMWVVPCAGTAPGAIVDPHGMSDALGVNRLLAGSVQRFGDGYRLSLDVLDAESLERLESRHVDFSEEEAQALQPGVVDAVAGLLHAVLPAGGVARREIAGEARVYECYLEGVGVLNRSESDEDLDRAIASLRRAIEADSSYAPAHARLAEACRRKSDRTGDPLWLSRAERHAGKALRLDPSLLEAHTTMAEVYDATGRPDMALERLRNVVSANPRCTSAYGRIGDILASQDRLEEAEISYKRMIEEEPDYYRNHATLGRFYDKTGRLDEAAAEYERALELAPGDRRTLNQLATVYFSNDRWEEAGELFERSFELRPECRTASDLGTIRYLQGEFEDAAVYYDFALEYCDTADAYFYRVLGNQASALHWVPGRRAAAGPLCRRAVGLAERRLAEAPDDPAPLGDLMGYYALLGDRDAVNSVIEAAAPWARDDEILMYRIGAAYEQIDRRDLALRYLSDAIRRGYPVARIEADPFLRGLCGDPRFQSMVRPGGDE